MLLTDPANTAFSELIAVRRRVFCHLFDQNEPFTLLKLGWGDIVSGRCMFVNNHNHNDFAQEGLVL